MLKITVVLEDGYDEKESRFVALKCFDLELEHSLVSLSKWESEFCKPFLGKDDKTLDETIWYVKAMTLTENVPGEVYEKLSNENIDAINAYIAAPMTATTFTEKQNRAAQEVITAEIIYWWMIGLGIPFDRENWHLNRLLTLIRVCNAKNAPPKKMSRAEQAQQQRDLNAKRKAMSNSKG
jgi:hypothetical protein